MRPGGARHLHPRARDEALAAGADAFLQKPFDLLELSTVKDLVGASADRSTPPGEFADERLTSGDGARRDPRRGLP
jgi:DNA-binding response OmpR family regulator